MILQAKIDQQIDEILDGPMPPMEILLLDPEDVGQEQYIMLFRGSKRDFNDATHFWLKARQRVEWWDRWGDGDGYGYEYENYKTHTATSVKSEEPIDYAPLSKNEFYDFINTFPCFKKLSRPLSEILGINGMEDFYVTGVRASIEWDSVAALAEFSHEFVAFHWATTA